MNRASPLTPTQKAKLTGTFFIRASFWTPQGNRIEMEIPWVGEAEGAEVLDKLTKICGRKMKRTNEQWEAIALKELDRLATARKKAREK